jgi:hypothetical protein
VKTPAADPQCNRRLFAGDAGMRRETVLSLGLLAGLVVLSGCGPEKEIPKEVPTTHDPGAPDAPAVPTSSQPEAVKVVERCVGAVTGGHPERLRQIKAVRQTVKGRMRWVTGQVVPTARKIEAVWPDRARIEFDFVTGDIKPVVIGLRRPEAWAYNMLPTGPQEFSPANTREYGDILAVEVIGHVWLPTLVPLVDPKTVVFGAAKETVSGQPADAVKVAVPGGPVYTLWLNEKTHLPGMVTYSHRENGITFEKRFVLSGHKPFGGLQLPTVQEYSRNGLVVEQWETTDWEFPDTIGDATFDRPSEKK